MGEYRLSVSIVGTCLTMGISVKKILLALNSVLLLCVWVLQLSFPFYPRDRSEFMFVGTYTLWMVTGIAHLKIFKLKAKLALLFAQTSISLALALVDTINKDHLKNRVKGQHENSVVLAIIILLWIVFAIFLILTILRLIKQFKGRRN